MIRKFGTFCTVKSEKKADFYLHKVAFHNAPGRVHSRSSEVVTLRRKKPLHPGSAEIRRCETIFIGQLLVSMVRDAAESGEITSDQQSTIQEIGNEIYGKGWVYSSREGQHEAVNYLFRLTGNPDHYYNDIRMEL